MTLNDERKRTILKAMLRNYPLAKAYIEATKNRLEAYKVMLTHDNINDNILAARTIELGMPRPPFWPVSQVEIEFERSLKQQQLEADTVKEWIADDESRIRFVQMEADQIEQSMKGLLDTERSVIEWKYFERCNWVDIEMSFNERFKGRRLVVAFDALRRIHGEALDKLYTVLEPFIVTWKT